MDLKRLRYINEILTDLMNHWLLFPPALVLSGIPSQPVEIGTIWRFFLFWSLCGLLPFAFFGLRTRLRSLFTLLAFQILAAVPICAAASSVFVSNLYFFELERLLCVSTAVLYLIYSLFLNLKFQAPFTKPLPLSAGIIVAVFCVGRMGRAEWLRCCLFPLILCIGLFFVTTYIQRYIEFINVNASSAGTLPAGDMLHSGLGLAAGYTAFGTALLLLLSSGSWLGRLSTFLSDSLEKWMRWLKAWIKGKLKGTDAVTNQDISAGRETGFFSGFPEGFKLNETSLVWKILEYVLVFLMIAFLLAALVVLSRRLLRYFQRISLLRIRNFITGDEEVFDVREKCKVSDRSGKKTRKHLGPLSYGERIRRLYRRKLLSAADRMTAQDSGRLGIYTAREWESRLSVPGMADLYERARYADKEMTAEDLDRMKAVCRE